MELMITGRVLKKYEVVQVRALLQRHFSLQFAMCEDLYGLDDVRILERNL